MTLSFPASSQAIAVAEQEPSSCRGVLLSNGVLMPSVGFGTAAMSGLETEQAVTTALKAGFRHFDGAEAVEWYDDAAVGRALQKAFDAGVVERSDVFISSKVHPKNLGLELTTAAVKKMLDTLQVSYLDNVLLHFSECGDHIRDCAGVSRVSGAWKESWRALESLYNEGLVRAIGVSNFDRVLLSELWGWAKVKPHVVQNWFDPFHQDHAVRKFCSDHGITYVGYSSLGGQHVGRLGHNPVYKSKAIQAISAKTQLPVSSVVLHWALARDVVVLPRSTNSEHIATNGKIANFFAHCPLSNAELAMLDALDLPADKNDKCAEWANKGECVNNSDFMWETCPMSCQQQEKKNEPDFEAEVEIDAAQADDDADAGQEDEQEVEDVVEAVDDLDEEDDDSE